MSVLTRGNRLSDPFALAQRELDTVFGHLMGANEPVARANPVDVLETAEGFVVEAELPGFTREQVDITLENNVLTLVADRSILPETKAEVEQPATTENVGYHLRERRTTRFQRNFKLPSTIDESSISAKLENGLLVVRIAKRPEIKPRKISVG